MATQVFWESIHETRTVIYLIQLKCIRFDWFSIYGLPITICPIRILTIVIHLIDCRSFINYMTSDICTLCKVRSRCCEFLSFSMSRRNFTSLTGNPPSSATTEPDSRPTSSVNTRPNKSRDRRQRPSSRSWDTEAPRDGHARLDMKQTYNHYTNTFRGSRNFGSGHCRILSHAMLTNRPIKGKTHYILFWWKLSFFYYHFIVKNLRHNKKCTCVMCSFWTDDMKYQ